jgi:hypothetical protein
MVDIFENAYGVSRKARRRSWIRKGVDVEL